MAIELPPDVFSVKAKGKTYFYHQRARGTAAAGPRTALGSDPKRLWEQYRAKVLDGVKAPPPVPGKLFADMVDTFRSETNPEWANFSDSTKRDYGFYLTKMRDLWGHLQAWQVTSAGVLAYRDDLGAESPGSANHMIVVGKRLYKWAVPRNWAKVNPFREISTLDTEDDGHWPWPDWAVSHVIETAPDDLSRAIFLAVETGQRESDFIRLGPTCLEGKGLWVRPQKTKKRRKAIWVPLSAAAMARVNRWLTEPMRFVGGRWGKEIIVPPGETFVLSPAGNPYTPEGLRSRWNRWLEKDAGTELLARWEEHERALRERDQMEIPETMKPTLHGLRATAVVRRRLAGYSHAQVSNDIGMSIQMVTRYSRFMDQQAAAASNIVMLEGRRK